MPHISTHLAVGALSNLLDAGVRALNAAAAPELIVAAASAGHFDGPFQRDVRRSLRCHGAAAGEVRLLSAAGLPAACCFGSSRPGPVALLLPDTGLGQGPEGLAPLTVYLSLDGEWQHLRWSGRLAARAGNRSDPCDFVVYEHHLMRMARCCAEQKKTFRKSQAKERNSRRHDRKAKVLHTGSLNFLGAQSR